MKKVGGTLNSVGLKLSRIEEYIHMVRLFSVQGCFKGMTPVGIDAKLSGLMRLLESSETSVPCFSIFSKVTCIRDDQ